MRLLIIFITTFVITGFTQVELGEFIMDECTELGENCRATAQENYENGTYTEAQYHMFYDNICPNAALECVLDNRSEGFEE